MLVLLMSSDPLLRPGHVANVLGITTKTLRRWSEAGRLPAYFVGGHRRYRRSDVQRLVIKPDGTHPGEESAKSEISTSK
jgi:excisionase family DNA binding protein